MFSVPWLLSACSLTSFRRSTILPALEQHRRAACDELARLIVDCKTFPVNYNHYYTDTIYVKRQQRIEKQLKKAVPKDILSSPLRETMTVEGLIKQVTRQWSKHNADMEEISCEETLDCLLAIYKV